jgi:RHS repeat-associated protein
MKFSLGVLASVLALPIATSLAAQKPVLGNIESPYPAIQTQVRVAGGSYGPGAVNYGPVGTPLVITGSGLGPSGSVQFVSYKNGAVDPTYSVSVSIPASQWDSSSGMIFVSVPSNAKSGLITVTSNGQQSNALPFIVTPGSYGGSCPSFPPNNQFQIVTSALHDGMTGQPYSVTLGATGGTKPYGWSIASGSLPAGLALNASTGVISGTPTSPYGPTNLTIQATDSSSPHLTDDATFSLDISSAGISTVVYSYSIPQGGYDSAGNVIAYTDSVTGTWSVTGSGGSSGYDGLNRLINAQATAGPYQGLQVTWNYDAFGNRTIESFGGSLAASDTGPIPVSSSATYNTSNRAQTASPGPVPVYDGAGNVTQDPENQYIYDAEGRICAVHNLTSGQMVEYLYDAGGFRIAKGNISNWAAGCNINSNGFTLTTSYVLGLDNEQLTEMTRSGSSAQWAHSNVFAAGQLIATYSPNPDPSQATNWILNYHLTDWLGTRRVLTDSAGNPQESCLSLPYGNGETCYPSPTEHLFTGKERDAESGNDYFGARYYASTMGRFLSPDPLGQWVADVGDPQSWNFYAYGRNNPLTNIDPTGLDCLYFNDAGTGVESIDPTNNQETLNKQASDCGANGGNWVNGKVNSVVDDGQGDFNVRSSDANGTYTTAMTAAGPQSNGTDCSGNCIYGYIGPPGPNNDDSLNPYAAAVFTQIGLQTGPTYEMASRAFCNAVTFGQAGAATASVAGAPIKKSWLGIAKAGGEGMSDYTTVASAWGTTLRGGGAVPGAAGQFLKSISTSPGSFAGTARVGGAIGRVANKVASSEAAGIVSALSLACIGGHP